MYQVLLDSRSKMQKPVRTAAAAARKARAPLRTTSLLLRALGHLAQRGGGGGGARGGEKEIAATTFCVRQPVRPSVRQSSGFIGGGGGGGGNTNWFFPSSVSSSFESFVRNSSNSIWRDFRRFPPV